MTLTESEYDHLAHAELLSLRDAIDALDTEEVEAELESGILTLEFEDDSRYVINSHQAARQIWMAADRSGWHFDWHPETKSWVSTKSSDELWSVLQATLTKKLATQITLRRPG